jgi:hypothetical protein
VLIAVLLTVLLLVGHIVKRSSVTWDEKTLDDYLQGSGKFVRRAEREPHALWRPLRVYCASFGYLRTITAGAERFRCREACSGWSLASGTSSSRLPSCHRGRPLRHVISAAFCRSFSHHERKPLKIGIDADIVVRGVAIVSRRFGRKSGTEPGDDYSPAMKGLNDGPSLFSPGLFEWQGERSCWRPPGRCPCRLQRRATRRQAKRSSPIAPSNNPA